MGRTWAVCGDILFFLLVPFTASLFPPFLQNCVSDRYRPVVALGSWGTAIVRRGICRQSAASHCRIFQSASVDGMVTGSDAGGPGATRYSIWQAGQDCLQV